MAQSASYDFTLTRDNLIDLALSYVSARGTGETPSADQVTDASRLFNMIVKLRAADGMPAWALKRGYILPFSGASSLNTDSHVVTVYDATKVTSTAASGAADIIVDSNTGMATSDQIGVELDGGTMQWTTINAIAGSTITLTSTLTGGTASGARVYTYTASSDRVQKPIRIIMADVLHQADQTSHEIDVVSRDEYYDLGARTSKGTPNQMYYTIHPSSDTALNTNGQIFVYPRFNDGDYVIEFTYQRPFADFDVAGDNPDFPQAFYLPLMLELASLLGPMFGVPPEERKSIFTESRYYWDLAWQTVSEEGSYRIIPEIPDA